MTHDPNFQRRALAIVEVAEGMTVRKPAPDGEPLGFSPEAPAEEIVTAYEAERAARHSSGGAPSALGDHAKMVTLICTLGAGNYRETAAHLARIPYRTLQSWCEKADQGGVYGGKRAEDGNAPKIIVQIGVRDGDVQVSVGAASEPAPLPATTDAATHH